MRYSILSQWLALLRGYALAFQSRRPSINRRRLLNFRDSSVLHLDSAQSTLLNTIVLRRVGFNDRWEDPLNAYCPVYQNVGHLRLNHLQSVKTTAAGS